MPTYGKKEFKESNVNYLNKDFNSLKRALVSYAESYFPNTYRDFNETSPGMMLLEMNAYVGDVTSFYIDQQYREMLLPLAEERRNVMNMAKMFGYKVKPIVPSFVDLTFTSIVDAMTDDRSFVDYTNASTFAEGIQVKSNFNPDLIFETLDVLDFRVSGSDDIQAPTIGGDDNLVTDYTLTRKVRAISGQTKSKTFTITSPEKFRKITLPETNVIDIISCIDTNGNEWYEVDFLAQDRVPIKKHYTQDNLRDSAYYNLDGQEYIQDVPVPYSLSYITSPKRFTRETNLDNTTSLIFGNGILKNGSIPENDFMDLEQLGIVIPGSSQDLNESIDPLLGNEYSTLGETPNQTTLTITYRVGGGIDSNSPSATISDRVEDSIIKLHDGGTDISTVTNETPAIGGKNAESAEEIREKTKAFFATQNRCVTKEDYEARVLNMSSRFGNIAKVYVKRTELPQNFYYQDAFANLLATYTDPIVTNIQSVTDALNTEKTNLNIIKENVDTELDNLNIDLDQEELNGVVGAIQDEISNIDNVNESLNNEKINLLTENSMIQGLGSIDVSGLDNSQGTIEVNILSYDNNKNLVGNPHALDLGTTDNIPQILKSNLVSYLDNFKLLTDDVVVQDGHIINFGVFFDIVAEPYVNKNEVKLRCIQNIINYFRIEKMQFSQPIYISKLEYELMGVEGVRSINYVTISQDSDYNATDNADTFGENLFRYSFDNGEIIDNENTNYGWYYDFQTNQTNKVILPPSPANPAVFELKNPRQNIRGVVR